MYHKAFTNTKKNTNLHSVVRINKNLAKADDFHFTIIWPKNYEDRNMICFC